MKSELIIPKDNKETTEKFKIDKGGICGLSCLAVIENREISEVMKDWKKYFGEFKGYANVKELRTYLERKGYLVKFVNRKGWTKFLRHTFIARIQWIGDGEKQEEPFYGWKHWTEASSYTHFILIHQGKKFFCNEENKWIFIGNLNNYLKESNGIVTSYLRIKRQS